MKKIIVLILAILSLSSCRDFWGALVGREYGIYVRNDTQRNIYVYGSYTQKDTLLPETKPRASLVNPSSSYEIGFPGEFIMSEYKNWRANLSENDTVRIFVFDNVLFEYTDWKVIRESYSVLVRYDLTAKDMDAIKYISYPPSEAMKDVKMWPPYEEVIKAAK